MYMMDDVSDMNEEATLQETGHVHSPEDDIIPKDRVILLMKRTAIQDVKENVL